MILIIFNSQENKLFSYTCLVVRTLIYIANTCSLLVISNNQKRGKILGKDFFKTEHVLYSTVLVTVLIIGVQK